MNLNDLVLGHTTRKGTVLVTAAMSLGFLGFSGCAEPGSSVTSEMEGSSFKDTPVVLGRERGARERLADGQEFFLSTRSLLSAGRQLFSAKWTPQEGGGRPLSKGTGAPLADPTAPLIFPDNFNRLSGPDANSCGGCHNDPFLGGGGDFVTNVFVLGQRFDFATFDESDALATSGAVDENGVPTTLQSVANNRATLGMFGSGYIEMLARQMTGDLQEARDELAIGEKVSLISKGVSFGVLFRRDDGTWDTSKVEGLPPPSLASHGSDAPPNLIVRPFHQAGAVISLRQFTNSAFHHHHGIQTTERFGEGEDSDGDGFVDEMSRAEVTAVTLWQATLPVPGRLIPAHPIIEQAVHKGEQLFEKIGCASCHIPSLPLSDEGWNFAEPNPYNPEGNLRPGDSPTLTIDLSDPALPGVRLSAENGVVAVQAYTDLRLHDITSGAGDPNREPLDMHFPAGSEGFEAGNSHFLTKKLWGAANEAPYFHHGKFTTMRQAILAHAGEAQETTDRFMALDDHGRDCIIEFLKTLVVLPPDTKDRIVNERGEARQWPPRKTE